MTKVRIFGIIFGDIININYGGIMSKSQAVRPFGARDKVGYMMGDFGCNMSFQLVSNYLMLFMTQGMGLSVLDWGIIVVLAKIFDAINDPIIGALVDSSKVGKMGKYRPWIFYGAFAIALTTLLLFIDIRAFSYAGKFAYCLGMYCVWSIAYTAANVPYGSLNAALTDDPVQRTSLSSLRSIGAGIAVAPIMVIAPKILYGEKDLVTGIQPIIPENFIWIALVCAVIGILGFMLTVALTKERTVVTQKAEKFNYFKTLGAFLKNRAALGMCLASFSQLVFVMSYGTLLPLVCQLVFGNGSDSGMVGMVMMLPMMAIIPFMSKLSKKFGKKEISMWPCLVAIAVLAIMLFIPFPKNDTGMWIYAALLGVTMLASGPFTLGTWSMVADCVDEQEIQTGRREEASVYATYSLARKIAQGAGAGFIAVLLALVGYNADNISGLTPQTIQSILDLSIILPLIGNILIFLVFFFIYNLSKDKVNANYEFLKKKHAGEGNSTDTDGENVEVPEIALAVEAHLED